MRGNRDRITSRDRLIERATFIAGLSGSTGRPNGVEVPRGALANLLAAMLEAPGLSCDDRMLALTTASFDMSVLELYLPLVAGATMVIADTSIRADGDALADLLGTQGVSVMQGTPATWRLLQAAGWQGRLRKILVGGESVSAGLARDLRQRADEVWNLYGPTETTVWSTRQLLHDARRPAIGKPIANTRVYILDRAHQLTPTGVPGEIWIAGEAAVLLGRGGGRLGPRACG